MQIMVFLAGAMARSLVLAAAGGLVMWLLRVKSAAARHAIWAAVSAGMLLSAALAPVLRPLNVRILPTQSVAGQPTLSGLPASGPAIALEARPPSVQSQPELVSRTDWWEFATTVYAAAATVFLLRLLVGYLFTRRLVRSSRSAGEFLESDWIAAPMTVGWLRPKILLPTEWREWEPSKLEAALAHERAHIRRADWAIRAMTGLNRCIFWFNPLAWWLERHLAMLAEEACDDAVLLVTGAREAYAQTLLEIAAAVRAHRGRLNWEAMAMIKPSEVTQRIERILDESRHIPRGLARGQQAALLVSATVLVYLTAALQPSSAHNQQEDSARVSASVAAPGQFETVSDAEAARLEAIIAANPEDLQSRAKLVQYYTAKAMVQQRDAHILWIVEHHPEFDQKRFPALTVFSNPGPLQDIVGEERVGQLWQEQAIAHANDPRVVMNAAQYLIPYYLVRRELYAAESWEKRRRELDSSREWGLGSFYAMAIIGSALGKEPYNDAGFAAHVRSELDTSGDGAVVWNAGYSLERSTSDLPDLVSLSGYGKQLQKRAVEQLGYTPPPFPRTADKASAATARNAGMNGPEPLKRVDPVYPPAAQQVRLQGVVRLKVLIAQDGAVKDVEIVNGHPMLVNAARDAVKQWVYPSQAMETLVEVEIPFRLP